MTKILQLKISLDEVKPEIWRKFLVEDSITFKKLHEITQIVMGWENYHMYKFTIDKEEIVPEEEGYNLAESSFNKLFSSPDFVKMLEQGELSKSRGLLDTDKINKIMQDIERNKPASQFNVKTKINQLIKSEKQEFTYIYDFGDSWNHTLIVEKILENNKSQKYPICLDGERACPPEDCGGTHGYEHLLDVRKNKKHKEYKELIIEWLGEDYNPELFVVDWVNAELHGKKPKAVWMMKPETRVDKISSKAENKGKPGRNEPCHCGSGIKYKKCCLDKDRQND